MAHLLGRLHLQQLRRLVAKVPQRANFTERSPVRALRKQLKAKLDQEHDWLWVKEHFWRYPKGSAAQAFDVHCACVGDDNPDLNMQPIETWMVDTPDLWALAIIESVYIIVITQGENHLVRLFTPFYSTEDPLCQFVEWPEARDRFLAAKAAAGWQFVVLLYNGSNHYSSTSPIPKMATRAQQPKGN